MKKYVIILIVNFIVLAAAIVCWRVNYVKNNSGADIVLPETPVKNLKEFTDIAFGDKMETYDGNEYEIIITGTLPEDTTVNYISNKATDAGVYNARAVVSKEGYKTLTLTAVLTINRAAFTGITFNDKSVFATGSEQSVTIEGKLPEGTSVSYVNNKATEEGEYTAIAVISNPNYETVALQATLTIKPAIEDVP